MILSCEIQPSARLESEGGNTTFTDRYIARVDSVKRTGMDIRRQLPKLQRWQRHPSEPGYYVERFEAAQHHNSRIWNIEVTYTDEVLKNPLEQPAAVSMRSQSLSSYTLVDHKNRLMLNTAGDPFEPQEKRETIWVITVKKNVASYPAWLLDYPESINSDAVRIRDLTYRPKTLALAGLTLDDYAEENDIQYLPLTLELHYRKSTWETFVPSRGFQAMLPAPGQPLVERQIEYMKQRIVLPDQTFPNEPQMLDAKGRWLEKPKPEDVVLLKFQIPEDKPFSVLPLK